MKSQLGNLAEKVKEMLESGKMDDFFNERNKKYEILQGRFIKFEKYLETIDFDTLIYRLVMEHGEEYREKCWTNGFEVYPNNKLQFLFDYVINKTPCVDVPEIESNFMQEIHEFNGYYFEIIQGQGVIYTIYNKEDLQVVLSI